ncbi:carbon starvation protein CstA [Clostridium aceticum]|uniref:Carbon starvation protein CstA n=1 Tax=Clostridium aceticum TaxID=84022 RepID=A0A0D8I628_9CLOT|nr:carbon starvation protein A [Clostridium aceticum]AKL96924.1 carbon starvation protein CstA [Clostridium aceticum]KJF25504.1 carbon starvation protein CstA [Clostridium aceticum]
MYSFLLSIVALFLGYFIYGKFVEKVFGINQEKATPANEQEDGVDYVPMDWKKIFLIQFLNIAGLGPIFGAISGALWGPTAFLWIVFGSIFAGGVHDFFSGMLSIRHKGASISEIVGIYLGNGVKQFMRAFSVILLILVGTVFMTGPAGLLSNLTGISISIWVAIIIAYYFLATILPVDKIIGKIYPLFGASLIIMAIGIAGGLLFKGYQVPEITLQNLHPNSLPLWPLLFVTIACGAISGFHATQSPMMARCVTNEKYGRRIFYGTMLAEGVIALIWAAAAMTFFGGTEGLLAAGTPAVVVNAISRELMGPIGGFLAMLGVIAAPITSGDTAFRSARLTIADSINVTQKPIAKRLLLAAPLFVIAYGLTLIDFTIIWRYFAWSNQTLAMIVLWTSAAYLAVNNKLHWIATIPATFMTAVSVTYILQAPEGLKLATSISYPIGISVALALLVGFLMVGKKLPDKAQISA